MDAVPDLAATEESAADGAPRWIVVTCNGRDAAIAAAAVREIVPPVRFTRIPGAGPEVCGLAGVRGRVVTAFDLGAILGGTPSRANPDFRLLLVEVGRRLVGLAVESVRQVCAMEPGAAASRDAPQAAGAGGDVLGTATVDGRAVVLLDAVGLLERRMNPNLGDEATVEDHP
jgi:chemotaxis signal transduction protein